MEVNYTVRSKGFCCKWKAMAGELGYDSHNKAGTAMSGQLRHDSHERAGMERQLGKFAIPVHLR